MKVNWREHEFMLAMLYAVIALMSYLWIAFGDIGMQFAEINRLEKAGGISLSAYRTKLLSLELVPLLLQFLAYCWINLKLVPYALSCLTKSAGTFRAGFSFVNESGIASLETPGKGFLKLLIILFQILLIIYILGPVSNFANFYIRQDLKYPDYNWFLPAHPQPFMNTFGGFGITAFFVGIYLTYVIIRETLIDTIVRNPATSGYRILISNQVTGLLVVVFAVAYFLGAFNIIKESYTYVLYFTSLLPTILIFLLSIHWIFPNNSANRFFSEGVILRIVLLVFFSMIPAMLMLNRQGVYITFLFQFLIVVPVSWFYYQQQRGKILQLRGMEKDLAKSNTDLQFLRSQINPHFLFNALNTLYGTALKEGAADSAAGIQKLGDMMRFMLHENNQDFIPMNKEIEYLKNYISLQKLRTQTSPNIIIEDQIPEQGCDHQIAPMLLIPFVENAFKHGISLTEKSWINIHLSCDARSIHFSVRNSIHHRNQNDPEKDKSGIGIKNVVERLKLLYGGKFEMSMKEAGNEFIVNLSIQPIK